MPEVEIGLFDLIVAPTFTQPAPEFNVNITPAFGEAMDFDLTLTTILGQAYAANLNLIGIAVRLDRGAEWPDPVPLTELGVDEISTGQHLDGYSNDLTLSLDPLKLNPLYGEWLRKQRQIEVDGILGVPGEISQRSLFRGYLVEASYRDTPPWLLVTFMDTASKYASQKVAINVGPGAGRTRGSIVREVYAALGIPVGRMSFGVNDGGLVVKPVSEGGTREVFSWSREFLSPVGGLTYVDAEGEFVTERPAIGTIARTFTSADVQGEVEVTLPSPTAPNCIAVSGSVFDPKFTELGDENVFKFSRNEELTRVPEKGAFVPRYATHHQDSFGVLTPTGAAPDPPEAEAIITRTVTDEWVKPDESITVITEYGWRAPRMAPREQHTDGTTNHYRSAYLLDDGTWSDRIAETFGEVQKTITRERRDGNSIVKRTTVSSFHIKKTYIEEYDAMGVLSYHATPITVEGEGWYASGYEGYYITRIEEERTLADDSGAVTKKYSEVWEHAFVPADVKDRPVKLVGPYSSKRGVDSILGYETMIKVRSLESTYVKLSDSSYKIREAEVTNESGKLPIRERTYDGARPTIAIEQKSSPVGRSQVVRMVFRDETDVALNGEIWETFENEYAENAQELLFLGRERRREHRKTTLKFTVPFDLSSHIGKTVALGYGKYANQPLLVVDVQRVLSPATGSNSQAITAYYWPPEWR